MKKIYIAMIDDVTTARPLFCMEKKEKIIDGLTTYILEQFPIRIENEYDFLAIKKKLVHELTNYNCIWLANYSDSPNAEETHIRIDETNLMSEEEVLL